MSDEPVGPGTTEPEELLTPDQKIQAQLDRIEKLLQAIHDTVVDTSGERGLGH